MIDRYNSEFPLKDHFKWNHSVSIYEIEDMDKTKEALSKHLELAQFEKVD